MFENVKELRWGTTIDGNLFGVDTVGWLRTYIVSNTDGTFSVVCEHNTYRGIPTLDDAKRIALEDIQGIRKGELDRAP